MYNPPPNLPSFPAFHIRYDDEPIYLLAPEAPPRPLGRKIQVGDGVELHLGRTRVLVDQLMPLPDGSWEGRIKQFQPEFHEYEGVRLYQRVRFSEFHVFCAWKELTQKAG